MLPCSTGLKATPLCQIDCTGVVNIANVMCPVLRFRQGKGVQHSDIVCRLAFVLLYVLGVVVLVPHDEELTACNCRRRQTSKPRIH